MKLIQSLKNKFKDKGQSFAIPVGVVIFTIGFCIMLYPIIGQLINYNNSREAIKNFNKEQQKFTNHEINRRIKLAEAYNSSIRPADIYDPFSETEKREGRKEYAKMLEVSEKIGHIEIPKIHEKIPIYAGTGENILQKGVGHLENTSLPIGGESTHCVLSAHRGLPKARLFTDLDKMQNGDVFFITNLEKKMAYKVDKISTVKPDDFDEMMIKKGKDYVTLLTCTPYMVNSHRLLVRGQRISLKDAKVRNGARFGMNPYIKRLLFLLLVLLIIMLMLWSLKKQLEKKKQEVKMDL